MTSLRRALAATLCLAVLAPAALAQGASKPGVSQQTRSTGTFDFYVHGFRAGILVFAGVESGNYYAVNGRFSTAGLMAMIKKSSYASTVKGTVTHSAFDTTFAPSFYQVIADPGPNQRVQSVTYDGNVPQPSVNNPPRGPDPDGVAPSTQAGTIDVLTALYATLSRIPADQACKVALNIFDGTRRARLTLWPTDGSKGTLQCGGEYRRVAGYSAEDMARPAFPFTLTYETLPHGMLQANTVVMDSIYGNASLKRR
ncbi:MAG: DUF3108 domain-containing protein [Paracoccaceae bacterium]|nr:DUF3108 domain-containing protein [Paracoccaceae bacterium]